jgi:hypothetical protein
MRKALRRSLVALWCLLSLCVLALWVRGQFRQDQFVYAPAGGRLWQIFSHSGEVGFSTATPWPNAERPQWLSAKDDGSLPLLGPKWWAGSPGPSVPPRDWDILGLQILAGPGQVPLKPDGRAAWEKQPHAPLIITINPRVRRAPLTAPLHFTDVYISLWLPTLLLAVYPALVVLKRAREIDRRRRARQNLCLCPGCGYDIRATPDAAGPLWDRCPECGRPTSETGPS